MALFGVLNRKSSFLNLVQRSRRISFKASSKNLDLILNINSQTFFLQYYKLSWVPFQDNSSKAKKEIITNDFIAFNISHIGDPLNE